MTKSEKIIVLSILHDIILRNTGEDLSVEELRNLKNPLQHIKEYKIRNTTLPLRFKIQSKNTFDDIGLNVREEQWELQNLHKIDSSKPVSEPQERNCDPNHVKRKIF